MAGVTKVKTVKLEAGTDLVGPVKFISFFPEKPNPNEPGKVMSAQWGLTGTWDDVGEARVYIDTYQLDGNPIVLGYAVEDGKWDKGDAKFKWVGTGPFRLHKYLKDKKAHVRITPAGAVGAVQPAQAGNGAQAERSPVAAASPALTPIAQWWAEQEHLMRHCKAVAYRIHDLPEDPDIPDQAAMSTAHSLFIQANREGKLPPPSAQQQAEAIRATFDAMPAALQDDGPPPWLQ